MKLPKNPVEKELFLKEIYDYCLAVNWESAKLQIIADKYNITISDVRNLARMYVRNYLPAQEYEVMANQITIALKKERLLLNLILTKINPILAKLFNKTTYQLWENNEEKEIVLKHIFAFCEKSHFDSEKTSEYGVWLGLESGYRILMYAKEYALDYLGYTDEQFHKLRMKHYRIKMEKINKNYPSISRETYDKLLNAETLEQISEIIESCGLEFESVRGSLANYINVHRNGDTEIKNQIKTKINMYIAKKQAEHQQQKAGLLQKRKSEQLKVAVKIIMMFVNDEESYTIERFCEKNNLEKGSFERNVTLVAELDVDLYALYKAKTEQIKKQKYMNLVGSLNRVIEGLKNGIEENGIARPFDLIDYFMITRISLKEILRLSQELVPSAEYRLLKRFCEQNVNGMTENLSVISRIMSERVIINCQKDNNGFPIFGTGEEFSAEQKEGLINYLKEKGIPINLYTYNALFRRYRDGFFGLNDKQLKKSDI